MNLFNRVYPGYKSICPHVHNVNGTIEGCRTPNKGLKGENDENRKQCNERYGVHEDHSNYFSYTKTKQRVAIIGTIVAAALAVSGAAVAALAVVSILPFSLPIIIGAAVVTALALAATGVFAQGWHAANGEKQTATAKLTT